MSHCFQECPLYLCYFHCFQNVLFNPPHSDPLPPPDDSMLPTNGPCTYRHSVHLIALIQKGLPKLTNRNRIYFLSIFAKVISLKAGDNHRDRGCPALALCLADCSAIHEGSHLWVSTSEDPWLLIHHVIRTHCQSNTPETTEDLEEHHHKECSVTTGLFHVLWLNIISFSKPLDQLGSALESREVDPITIGNLLFWQMKHKDSLSLMSLKSFLSLAYIHMAQRIWEHCLRALWSMYSN